MSPNGYYGRMKVRNTRELGVYVRARRAALGMDQTTLAGKAGTSRKWLIEVERGKPGVELGLVLRTLRALDVAVDLAADVPVNKPTEAPKPKSRKAAAIKPVKRPRRLSARRDPADLPAADIDEVLHALKKAVTRR